MQINRDDLLAKMEMLQPGLSSREDLQQSSCIVFRDGVAATFNEEISCRIKVPLKFTAAVPAAKLMVLLRKLPDETIDVELSNHELLVRGKKRRRAGIPIETEIVLAIDVVEKPDSWGPLDDEFSKAVALVESCGSRDVNNFTLTCVHLTPKWVEACDRKQITRYRMDTGIKTPALVKRDSIKQIVALGMVKVAETDTWLHFKNSAGLVLSLRRFVEDYPAMKEFLKVEGTPTKLPKGLAAAVDLAEEFSRENAEVNHVTVKIAGDKLTVRGEGPMGWFEEPKKIVYSGQPMSFTISPAILSEIVRSKMTDKCIVSQKRLKVDGGKWVYITCLGIAKQV